jgi:hypothetical protein
MKRWTSSKTFWFNILTSVATCSGFLLGVFTLSPVLAMILITLNAIANIALRFVTTTSLTK